MALTRREWLKRSAGAAAGLTFLTLPGARLALGAPGGSSRALLVIFLRGGSDGLSLVAPVSGEDRKLYVAARPNLQLAIRGDGAALPLEERFGLHPAGRPLLGLYEAKRLAVVHAAGLSVASRSHGDAQAMAELGSGGKRTGGSGWLARWLAANQRGVAAKGEAAVAVGGLVPTMLSGFAETLAVTNPGSNDLGAHLGVDGPDQALQRLALRQLYSGGDWLSAFGRGALDALDRLEGLAPDGRAPAAGVHYPPGEIGGRLRTVAQLMKSPLGVVAAAVDMGGWDTHQAQGSGGAGRLADQLGQLSLALNALLADLGKDQRLTVVVQSEFGRRLKENASQGTDHGHGNVMLVLGDGVVGGKVYGTWPGLKADQLYGGADLAVTTDYRQVLFEVLSSLGPAAAPEVTFPGFKPGKSLGLMG